MNPLTQIDFYKADHRRQYPSGTTLVYSNLTARSAKYCGIPEPLFNGAITFFGLQYFIKHFLIDTWNREFFHLDKEEVVRVYKRRMDNALGKDAIPTDHIEALHDLGHLPICIRALPEGTQVPIKVPCMVIYNTHPDFFWLTNYLETVLSAYMWKPITSATIAKHYRILLTNHAKQTGQDDSFVNFQAHDFSFRGMSGPEDAALSGAAHLTSFVGTDSVPAIDLLEEYYLADVEKEMVGVSVPATEHSVMCMGTKDDEINTFRRLITELYPTGIVSIVSDTWDFWKVIDQYAKDLFFDIIKRDGKVVFRPDSGNPVDVICGLELNSIDWHNANEAARKGAVECLWDTFGGTVNEAGYKVLDPHVGVIYGDSITLERAHMILKTLKKKGFAASNIVFGVGSFTYQHVTRDSFGFAVKSTAGCVDGKYREIFKDPITDSGVKKSAKGFIMVKTVDGKLQVFDQQDVLETPGDEMREVFRDGHLLIEQSLQGIRQRIKS